MADSRPPEPTEFEKLRAKIEKARNDIAKEADDETKPLTDALNGANGALVAAAVAHPRDEHIGRAGKFVDDARKWASDWRKTRQPMLDHADELLKLTEAPLALGGETIRDFQTRFEAANRRHRRTVGLFIAIWLIVGLVVLGSRMLGWLGVPG